MKRSVGPFKLVDYGSMYARAAELFGELKSETRPRDLVKQMSGGQRQAVAIARTRLSDAKIVLMDEPTAAITVRQVAEVLDLIRRLKHQGIAIVLISHRMPDVFAVCDRVVVMRRGTKVADKAIATSPRGGDRPDHRRHPRGLRSADDAEHPAAADQRRHRRRHRHQGADGASAAVRQPAVLGDDRARHHLSA